MTERVICPRFTFLIFATVLFLSWSSSALGQVHTTGFNLQKSCPVSVTPGQAFQCQFTVQNNDAQHGVINVSVTNTVPFPGGTTTPYPCLQGGSAVTTLGPSGSPTDSCSNFVDEIAPACTTNGQYVDQVVVSANDAFDNVPVSSSVTNSVPVPTCPVHETGFNLTKTCPVSVASGASFQCTFTVENRDEQHPVVNLVVTNQVPFPGGTISQVPCSIEGSPVTSLAISGTAHDMCTGVIDETAPVVCPSSVLYADQVSVSGNDLGTTLPVNATVTNAVTVEPEGSGAPGPHATGFSLQLSCPISVASGGDFQCTLVVQNLDTQHKVNNLSIVSRWPRVTGTAVSVSCLQAGVPVTSLGWTGSATDSCTATVDATAPVNCGASLTFVGEALVNGTDACDGIPVSASVTNAVSVTSQSCAAPTPAGSDVEADLGPLSVVFDSVATSGTTTATSVDPTTAGSLPSGGYAISNLGLAYEITTTASVSGPITIGFVVPSSVDQVTFNSLRVLHAENNVLVDRTYFSAAGCVDAPGSPCPAPNFATHTIYAQVSSLSPFVIATLEAPAIQSVTVPADPVSVGTTIDVQGTFTDPGTHTAEWDWGDGTTSAGTVVESNGFGTVTGSHVYTSAGVYRVVLTVSDGEFESERVSDFVVVYDPNGGFVTGSGWISSPAGAYAADTSLTGRATFGFVSKYATKNASVPTGDTQFDFAAADFRFNSESYEWMLVSGAKARYRGVGKVNGAGSYGFELTAWDGQVYGIGPDKIRVKIWDRNQGNAVVYDNQINATDGADPTTALGGGSIVVHKK